MDIAIVGASCRFPGASDLDSFWSLLVEGRNSVSHIGADRFATGFYGHPRASEQGKSYSWSAGIIENIHSFDPGFFGISAREAAQMDPQQRILLELTWQAFEDAGFVPRKLRGSATGVYIGASGLEYLNRNFGDPSGSDAYFMTGNQLSIFSNRISYIFDLNGPSFTVDTACSSSLVALHLACQDLRQGTVSMAVAGGINALLSPFPFIGFSRANMLSKRGRCASFDARGDGYVRGEGGGVALLKPLEAALRDGDRIRGVIAASGVNSDGRTVGMSLPSRASQAALLEQVYRESGIDPDSLGFVEAHGTGTPVGDPIEAGAIGDALGSRRRDKLPIGSVKSNIGHLEPASGMAGLFKAMLALEHDLYPAIADFLTPNRNIDCEALNLAIAAKPVPLSKATGMTAGVSSFGFGGTNAHIILKRVTPKPAKRAAPQITSLAPVLPPLLLSAQSAKALPEVASAWRERVTAADDAMTAKLVRGAARHRSQHPVRLAVTASSREEILTALADFADKGASAQIVSDTQVRDGRLAYFFSGNGCQWAGMGVDAFRTNTAFRRAVEETDALLQPRLGWSVAERLLSVRGDADTARTDVAQPLLFAVQVGIVKALEEFGLSPIAVAGHSVGEIAAAWASGALSLADAARAVVVRSHHQQRTAGAGRMAVIGASTEEAAGLISHLGLSIDVAAVNAARSITIVGALEELRVLEQEAKGQGLVFSHLDLNYAFHSPAMDPVRSGLLEDLAGLSSGEPHIEFVSTVTAQTVKARELDAFYWWRNIRDTVRFRDAALKTLELGADILVEIGPHPVLQSYLRDAARSVQTPRRVISTLTRRRTESDPFRTIAAACHAAGADISGAACYDGPATIDLPAYPWQREDYDFPRTADRVELARPDGEHPLLGYQWLTISREWTNHLDTVVQPWLDDHRVENTPVLPAAAIVEIGLALAASQFDSSETIEVRDVEIVRAMTLDSAAMKVTRVTLEGQGGGFLLESRGRQIDSPWVVHAIGVIASAEGALPQPDELPGTPRRVIDGPELYRLAAALGLQYGPEFQVVETLEIHASGLAVARFRPVDPLSGYYSDPRLVDGALQALIGLLAARHDAGGILGNQPLLLPWRFDGVRFSRHPGKPVAAAIIRIRRPDSLAVTADISLVDEFGASLLSLRGCQLRPAATRPEAGLNSRLFRLGSVAAPLDFEGAAGAGILEAAGVALAPHAAGPDSEDEAALLIDAFLATSAFEALAALTPAGSLFSIDTAVSSGLVHGESRVLFAALLKLLERHDFVQQESGLWSLASASEIPAAVDIWRTLFYGYRDLAAVTSVLSWIGRSLLPRLRQGSAGAGPIPSALREQLIGSGGLDGSVGAVADAVVAIAGSWPSNRSLRILELGTGNGLLAARILRAVAHSATAIDYVIAEKDGDVASLVQSRLPASSGANVRGWDPAALTANAFDLVVSVGGLSLGGFKDQDLSALAAGLTEGGLLIAAEPEPNILWDFTLGLDQTGWLSAQYATASAPRPGTEWARLLTEAGFGNIGTLVAAQQAWPSTVVTAVRAAGPERHALPGTLPAVILVGDGQDDFARQIKAELIRAQRPVAIVQRPVTPERMTHLIRAFAEEQLDSVVVILPPTGTGDETERAAAATDEVAAIARIVAELEQRLWFVAADTRSDITAAALHGFARVLANEYPKLLNRRIDLDSRLSQPERVRAVTAELGNTDMNTEVRWDPQGRKAVRLKTGLPVRKLPADAEVRLTLAEAGAMHRLSWVQQPRLVAGPGEVVIDVKAAGLNFRDVMWSMSLIPEEALADGFAGASMGMECAGIVKSVGAGVTGLRPGDRVMAFAPSSFASEALTRAECALKLRDDYSFADGATIPVAFLTVLYSLKTLGRLRAGETVLIHGGAGAVGLAAIQYAQHIGATIVTTAGSDIKRSLLRDMGVTHVLNSRSLKFADEVLEITGGKGVDVVLNSLSGDAMRRSLELLKPFGRFLELGKRDFYANSKIGLRPVRHNVSYFAIDADELVARHPEIVGELLADLQSLFEADILYPLPRYTFPFSDTDDAFRLMRASGHVGKIVMVPDDDIVVAADAAPALTLTPQRTVVVSGGIGGFGLATALWLVEHCGATHLALLGRRGARTPGAEEARQKLIAAGAEDVRLFACDVGDEAALDRTLKDIRSALPPIGGVVHAAMVLRDGLIAGLQAEAIRQVFAPKLAGALNLDRLTRQDPVEVFLLFSSATTVLGSPGQASYVAANAAVEAIARRRQAEGLPALAVGWGPIADAGYLAHEASARKALTRRLGAVPLTAEVSLSALPAMLAAQEPVFALSEVNWSRGRSGLAILGEPMFADLAGSETGISDSSDILAQIEGKPPEEIHLILLSFVLSEVSSILRVPKESLDPHRPLSEIGMDSLMAMELRLALEGKLKIEISTLMLNDGVTSATLAFKLPSMMAGAERADVADVLIAQHETLDPAQGRELVGSLDRAALTEAVK